MPGEEETKVGSSAHLIAASTTTQTTIVPSSSVKSPTTTTTTTTCATTTASSTLSSSSSNLVGNNNSGINIGNTTGVGPGPPTTTTIITGTTGSKKSTTSGGGSIVNVNTNRLSQVSLKKSEDGSLSVSILQEGNTPTTNKDPITTTSNVCGVSSKNICAGDDVTDEEEDGSKLELELQFAGIDNETAELDLEEDDNNMDSNGRINGNGHQDPSFNGNEKSRRGSPTISTSGGGGGARQQGGPTTTTNTNTTGGSRSGSVGVGGGGNIVVGTGLGTVETMDEEEDEDIEGGKTVECTEVIVPLQTLGEKCLFYVTAFFILLAVFSLFAFLFLVPFVIDPAFTTIFMEFDPEPALCLTTSNVALKGSSNCNWTSCREGCTRETFSCTQIRVNYRHAKRPDLTAAGEHLPPSSGSSGSSSSGGGGSGSGLPWSNNNNAATSHAAGSSSSNVKNKNHYQQNSNNHLTNIANNKFNAALDPGRSSSGSSSTSKHKNKHKNKPSSSSELTRSGSGESVRPRPEWDYFDAHLFPNVKGCGYPPIVVCKDWYDTYGTLGTNFSCYYSKVDRGLVVTSFDMKRVHLDLVFAMFVPIPCFIISVIYLIFAYFRLYNTDSSSSTRRASTAVVNQSSTNNNIQAGTAGGSTGDPDGDTSLSLEGEKTRIITKSTSRGLNAVDKLLPNSGKGLHHSQVIEMNDLNPQLHNPADGDLLLPRRNNRAPERNGPANPAAKNKGGSVQTLLGGFEETDF